MTDPDYDAGLAFLVTIPDNKAVRVNISLPEMALRQIDAAAKQQGFSRSAFLVRAARKFMEAR